MQWFEPSLDKMGPIQVQHFGVLGLCQGDKRTAVISRRRRHEHEAYRNEKVRAERYGSVAKLRQVQARDGAQNLPRHAQTLLLDSLPHEGAPASEEADAAKRIAVAARSIP